MPRTAGEEGITYPTCEAAYPRKTWACGEGNDVDIVGVTGSIPVTPTIRTQSKQPLSPHSPSVSVEPSGFTEPAPLRVLVCGGRDFKDRAAVARELDPLRNKMQALLSGGAPGADTLAWDWGWSRNFHCDRIFADWKTHGRAAGPIRNQRMIDEWKPTLVIAFAGGRGTADMIRRAKAAGIEVREVSASPVHPQGS